MCGIENKASNQVESPAMAENDANGNMMLQSFVSTLLKKKSAATAVTGKTGKKMFDLQNEFDHAAARGGTCAFTFTIVNTLFTNSSRDDRPSIST